MFPPLQMRVKLRFPHSSAACSLSFGYVVTADAERGDGIRELRGIDLFETSVVPHPANPDTRIVEMKSIEPLKIATFEC